MVVVRMLAIGRKVLWRTTVVGGDVYLPTAASGDEDDLVLDVKEGRSVHRR